MSPLVSTQVSHFRSTITTLDPGPDCHPLSLRSHRGSHDGRFNILSLEDLRVHAGLLAFDSSVPSLVRRSGAVGCQGPNEFCRCSPREGLADDASTCAGISVELGIQYGVRSTHHDRFIWHRVLFRGFLTPITSLGAGFSRALPSGDSILGSTCKTSRIQTRRKRKKGHGEFSGNSGI